MPLLFGKISSTILMYYRLGIISSITYYQLSRTCRLVLQTIILSLTFWGFFCKCEQRMLIYLMEIYCIWYSVYYKSCHSWPVYVTALQKLWRNHGSPIIGTMVFCFVVLEAVVRSSVNTLTVKSSNFL